MGFFKEFKDDFSQAVNGLVPGDGMEDHINTLDNDDMEVNTFDLDMDTESEFSKLNGLLEQVTEAEAAQTVAKPKQPGRMEQEYAGEVTRAADMEEQSRKREETMDVNNRQITELETDDISSEVTVITEGTDISGDISSSGSVDIRGKVTGKVACGGKLAITGVLEGDSDSAELFADAAKIEGEIKSTGTVKIGIGSVVIGNITAASAVIAGAIKGDIDVQGPAVVDTSAVIMGNIKSRSVQINNGAVIEGFCSQCYADVDVKGFFEDDVEEEGN